MEDNYWKVLHENIYVYIDKKRIIFKNIQSKYKHRYNYNGVFKIKYISQINKDNIKIVIIQSIGKIVIARLNLNDFKIKNLFSYFKFQRYILFASNLIFWQMHSMIVTNTWKSKNIRVFNLIGVYKVPYELRKLVPKFINIVQIYKSQVLKHYVVERINDIFLLTFKINHFNQELVETKQIGNFYLQKYMLFSSILQNCKKSRKNRQTIYYVDSEYVKNAQGVYGKLQLQNFFFVSDISKFKELISIFYTSCNKNYIYMKNIHSNQQKTFEFGSQYNPLTMRNPKFFEDNVVLREIFKKRRILIISISEQINSIR